MRRRVKKYDLPTRPKPQVKIPFKSFLLNLNFIFESFNQIFGRNPVQISRIVFNRQTEAIKSIQTDLQLLKIRYLNYHLLVRLNISHFNCHEVCALRTDLPISGPSPFVQCLSVFLLRFISLFHPPLQSLLGESSSELMDTNKRRNRKFVRHLQKLLSEILILLHQSHLAQAIDNVNAICNFGERKLHLRAFRMGRRIKTTRKI